MKCALMACEERSSSANQRKQLGDNNGETTGDCSVSAEEKESLGNANNVIVQNLISGHALRTAGSSTTDCHGPQRCQAGVKLRCGVLTCRKPTRNDG
jgi:hypothetical protein